jgi:hypothetical protein
VELTAPQALAIRMTSLLLDESKRPTDVAGVVTWFGAMQAQDAASAMWSLGVRLPEFTVDDVQAALERREALRTWPMRGTVHLVPARDAHWMLEVLGERALAGSVERRSVLGLDAAAADRAVDVLASALAGGGRLTRAECMARFAEAGIETPGNLGYHLLWYTSQRGVTCIAPNIGKEQTFVLLDEWVPDPHRLDREEALATIAIRYFRSHGPTTRRDFAGWTGLTATDAKRAIAAAGDQLTTVLVEGTDMVVDPARLDVPLPGKPDDEMIALPGFDEYLLGFKDRSMMVAPEHKQAIIPGGNGVFQPTIVRAGRVIATWKRTTARANVTVTVQPLIALKARDRKRIEGVLDGYGRFVGKPVQVRWP